MCKDPLLLPRDRRGMGGSFGFSDGVIQPVDGLCDGLEMCQPNGTALSLLLYFIFPNFSDHLDLQMEVCGHNSDFTRSSYIMGPKHVWKEHVFSY